MRDSKNSWPKPFAYQLTRFCFMAGAKSGSVMHDKIKTRAHQSPQKAKTDGQVRHAATTKDYPTPGAKKCLKRIFT